MRKRPLEQVWKIALTVIALAATVMALYVQLFERRSRQEEARLAASRLEEALAESRTRLKAEIVADLRAELAKGEHTAETGTEPAPDTILRRLEAGENASGGLQQALAPLRPQEALVIAKLYERLESLARQMEESDRALRRDLEELRAAARRESDASHKTMNLILVVLIPLVFHFLSSLWQSRHKEHEKEGREEAATEP